ncbi:MAG: nuclear transport factor 2 family protein [Melioribacteraceae bacterium]|nr:nuclear transport factor 2 family protein [Melioribacteraceae bacterium]MCF8353973.1 nuclear transport factor 2 family protein [Melioribacteraceae bacterium]MCF8393701.1 nuclear transport factor 2 family protein [Melioribacteraceae bacterium]MCF8419557.1 nuclear transport factor 2 family protein [Melioribacteraceae bacterium]
MKNLAVFFIILFLTALSLNAQDKSMFDFYNEASEKAMLSGDYESLMQYYAEDAYSLPSYEPMMHGMDDFKKSIEMQKQMGFKFTDFDLETVAVFGNDDLMVQIGTYTMVMEMEQMPMPFEDKGKFMNVFTKSEDGSWKVKAETWNSDINPWEMMQNMAPPPPPEK